jgi:hypothetical protein
MNEVTLRSQLQELGVELEDHLAAIMTAADYRAMLDLVRHAGWAIEWTTTSHEEPSR